MESSENSQNPRPDPGTSPIRLFLLLANEDHPKACTGRKLLARGLASRANGRRPGGGFPIVLDPFSPTPLSGGDRARAEREGVLAVDCSWNRLAQRGGFPEQLAGVGHQPHRRRLPVLVAANPQHFGRVGQLNTAEALAAALYLLGRPGSADRLLSGFTGGTEFLRMNQTALDRYGQCPTPEAVLRSERELAVPPAR